jgi:hypothetical protein
MDREYNRNRESHATPPGVWSAAQLVAAINERTHGSLEKTAGTTILHHIRMQFNLDTKLQEATYKDITIPRADADGPSIVKYGPEGHVCYGIRATHGKTIVEAYAREKEKIATHAKPDGFISVTDFAKMLIREKVKNGAGRFFSTTGISQILHKLHGELEANRSLQEIVYAGVSIPRAAFIHYSTDVGAEALGIREEVAKEIMEALKRKNGVAIFQR